MKKNVVKIVLSIIVIILCVICYDQINNKENNPIIEIAYYL